MAMHVNLPHGEELAFEDHAFGTFLMDLREISVYGGVVRVSDQNARRAVEGAQRIIAARRGELSCLD